MKVLDTVIRSISMALDIAVERTHMDDVELITIDRISRLDPVLSNDRVFFPIEQDDQGWTGISMSATEVTDSEIRLITLVLRSELEGEFQSSLFADLLLPEWQQSLIHWIQGEDKESITDLSLHFSQLKIGEQVVPFLLSLRENEGIQGFKETFELLDSFTGGAFILLPMDGNQWLLLFDSLLLEDGSFEAEHSSVESMGEALSQVIQAETALPITLTLHDPCHWTSLPQAYHTLQTFLQTGLKFVPGKYIYSPRNLLVEYLLDNTSDAILKKWREAAPTLFAAIQNEETRMTLNAFYANEGHLSGTAKALYIHRNTLLYRLDRIKQDTGWDVRRLNDAQIIRLALLIHTFSPKSPKA